MFVWMPLQGHVRGAGGGGLRSAFFSAMRQFRNFPEFFRHCFLRVHLACLLVPVVHSSCRTISFNVFSPQTDRMVPASAAFGSCSNSW